MKRIVTGWTEDYYVYFKDMCDLMLESVKRVYPTTKIYLYSPDNFTVDVQGIEQVRIPDLREKYYPFYDWIRYYVLGTSVVPVTWIDSDCIMFKLLPVCQKNFTVYSEEHGYPQYRIQNLKQKDQEILKEHYPEIAEERDGYGFNAGIISIEHSPMWIRQAARLVLDSMTLFPEEEPGEYVHHYLSQSLFFRYLRKKGVEIDTYQRLCNQLCNSKRTLKCSTGREDLSLLLSTCLHLCFGGYFSFVGKDELKESGVCSLLLDRLRKTGSITLEGLIREYYFFLESKDKKGLV